MRRIVWGLAVAWVAGCSYPSFEFATGKTTTKKTTSTSTSTGSGGAGGSGGTTSAGGSGGTTGAGGSGGTSTGAGGSGGTSTGTGGSGGAPHPPTVECQYGDVTCAVGQVCCYHSAYGACDHCAAPKACLPYDSGDPAQPCNDQADKYYKLACAENADCAKGNVCCGNVVDGQNGKVILGTFCAATCDQPNYYEMCVLPGAPCEVGVCTSADYGSYGYCAK